MHDDSQVSRKKYTAAIAVLLLWPWSALGADTPTAPNQRPGWEQGGAIGERVNREVQNNPGGRLYGPGQGMTPFQTFEENAADRRNFSASIHGHEETRYDVGRIELCITNFTNLGLNLNVRSMAPDGSVISSNAYSNVGGLASYGVAVCNTLTTNFSRDCSYYRWNFDRGQKTLFLDNTTARQTSNVNGRPLHQALDAMSCLNAGCDSSVVNMNVLNYEMHLNTLAMGALQAIREAAPQYIPTVYRDSDGVGHCLQYSITSLVRENTSGTATENTCWDSVGNVVNCESIQHLQERASYMGGVLNQSEVHPATSREYAGSFYTNATTNTTIRTPYSLVASNNTGAIADDGRPAQTFICNVSNAPYGSRQGFVNRIVNVSRSCPQDDWNCINRAVVDSCAQYESDPACTMTEEKRDNVPTYQFGQTTPYNRTDQICFGLYDQQLGGLPSTDNRVVTPVWAAAYTNYTYQPVDIGQSNPYWQTCGNFRTISRNYVCTQSRLERLGINPPAFSENVRQGLESAAKAQFDSNTDRLTSYTYRSTDPSTGTATETTRAANIPFLSNGAVSSGCVQSCVVERQASNRVYSDGRTRGDIGDCAAGTGPGTIHPCRHQQAPAGETIATPTGLTTSVRPDGTTVISEGSMTNFMGQGIANLAIAPASQKEIRTCDHDAATNTFICPVNTTLGESIVTGKDCQCLNLLGDALSYTSVMREVSQDITCGDQRPTPAGRQIERVDDYLTQNNLRTSPDCGGGNGTSKYVCGWSDPALGTGNRLECTAARGDSQRILAPMTVRTWANNNYECMMSWADHDEVAINLGGMTPKAGWFDYCYDSLKTDATNFVLVGADVNANHPPVQNFCSPAATPFNGTKPSCGYDNWAINSGSPTRGDAVSLSPLSNAPFGYVNMTFRVHRQYDCTVQMGASDGSINDNTNSVGEWYVGPATPNGPIDCNNDGWLDYYNCTWRSAGYDCNKDCIADNSTSACTQINGWDCHRGDGCDKAEYASCNWRNAGYDFNGDQIVDSASQNVCSGSVSNVWCGTVACGTTNACTGCTSCTGYQCNPVETCSAWSAAVVVSFCGPTNTIQCTGPIDWPGGVYNGSYYFPGTYYLRSDRTCTTTYSTCYICPQMCTGTYVSSGWDCAGTPAPEYLGATECAPVSGADCGQNGGALSNQTPDGCIDNNTQYCAHVTQGWDCNPQSWPGSNNGIDGGSCSTRANLADSECVRGALKCSRNYHPNDCCLDVEDITERVDIRNDGANEYTCNLKYTPTSTEIKQISYNNPATSLDDEHKFLVEGCSEKWVETYLTGSIEGQEFNYYRYEDIIHLIASDRTLAPRCDYREPSQYCYCKEDPFRAAGNTNFIQIRDIQNSGMELR